MSHHTHDIHTYCGHKALLCISYAQIILIQNTHIICHTLLTLKSYPSNYPTNHNSNRLHIFSYPMVQPYPYSYPSYSCDYYVSYLGWHFQIVVASLNLMCRVRVLPIERQGLLDRRLLCIYHIASFVVEYASFILQ